VQPSTWRGRRPPSQGWRTFLRNQADGIAAMDLFVVPTMSFRLLYGLLILRHDRRRLLWLGATAYPTAEWIARQLTEACGWDQAPRYLIRDRDRSYGEVFVRRVRAMGIRDRPTSPRSPWLGHAPKELLAKNFDLPASTFASFPKTEVYFAKGAIPPAVEFVQELDVAVDLFRQRIDDEGFAAAAVFRARLGVR
jgi:hypothetical protein